MEDLTFGEQVKIILGRKGMTIKQLAELIEVKTGRKMSRQNLTQRLGRDNFQEQDMRMIAGILECPFHLSIMGKEAVSAGAETVREASQAEEGGYDQTPAEEPHQEKTEQAEAAEPHQEEAEQPEAAEPHQEKAEQAEAAEPHQEKAEQAEASEPHQEKAEQPEAAEPHQEKTEQPEAEETLQEETEQTSQDAEPEIKPQPSAEDVGPDERDMTIGELYDIHRELNEMEESIKAGEPVEKAKEALTKKKKSRFSPGIFLRRRKNEDKEEEQTPERNESDAERESEAAKAAGNEAGNTENRSYAESADEFSMAEDFADFEPVISRDDSDEDITVGDVNPYTGREYQSNSVRMHPTRIGYVQVYDRSIHKWTDMTEWAFLGYQERKKTLLGKDYEPPIYLD